MTYLGERPNTKQIMSRLKDFQRDTVNYVFKRLYGKNPVRKFLIADEVGLGKTMVARGLIAKAIDHLWESPDRIDIIYICSNGDIARQNINRLNVVEGEEFAFASRITLLPSFIGNLNKRRVNFVSFTPSTSLDLKTSTGIVRERAIIWYALQRHFPELRAQLGKLFQGDASDRRWKDEQDKAESDNLDNELLDRFSAALADSAVLKSRLLELCEKYGNRGWNSPLPQERRELSSLIGKTRSLLAMECVNALQPDLIILDEFQRFRDILDGGNETSRLAQELMNYSKARVLLLSATPYKMYTINCEEENHHKDFLRTMKFLIQDKRRLEELKTLLNRYRAAICRPGTGDVEDMCASIEAILRKVMVRTERLAVTPDRNGMIKEMSKDFGVGSLCLSELQEFEVINAAAEELKAGDQLDYWKSAPYLLNFMESYRLKEKLRNLSAPGERFAKALCANPDALLRWETIKNYKQVEPRNFKLRALFDDTIESEAWKLLWLPPTLPYYKLSGAYSSSSIKGFTKSLIFSNWKVVPKSIAAICSYEAERRMTTAYETDLSYPDIRKRQSANIKFEQGKELKGMSNFSLFYPSFFLATRIDPLSLYEERKDGELVSSTTVWRQALQQLNELLANEFDTGLPVGRDATWAALASLDGSYYAEELNEWLSSQDNENSFLGALNNQKKTGKKSNNSVDDKEGVRPHIELLRRQLAPKNAFPAGEKTIKRLAKVALASPATVALRSLLRIFPIKKPDAAVMTASAQIANGFRYLFNLPESILLINSLYNKHSYWEKTLDYCIDGNIQAVMDEYVHILMESLGLLDKPRKTALKELAREIYRAVSLRTAITRFDELRFDGKHLHISNDGSIRCRFAMPFGFGKMKSDDESEETREDHVRAAFNSPFRPFVLASTSIGQEGLDFHQYCHRVYHWNLPSNPVDLEQREGRVHRYKCHVVRKNVAKAHGQEVMRIKNTCNPWDELFRRAKASDSNDLVPYWIYETPGGARIERRVPLLPLSKDKAKLGRLKENLALYRLTFGQPRQEELIGILNHHDDETRRKLEETAKINLAPKRSINQLHK